MPAGVAPDPGKPLGEVAAAEELLHHAADDRPEETILLSACQCTKSGGTQATSRMAGPSPAGHALNDVGQREQIKSHTRRCQIAGLRRP